MEFLSLIGRFHPLVLHIPIGIFVFVFLVEIYARIKKTDQYKSSISLGLITGTAFAIFSCITGLLLAKHGDYSGETVLMHKRLSIAFTVLAAMVSYAHLARNKPNIQKLYFPLLSICMGLLMFTGHQGGSLTHGEGFLSKSIKQKPIVQSSGQEIAYNAIIKPILENKCVSCHNTTKTKGKLIMTSEAGLKRGGENGKLFVMGNARESLMMQRIQLESEDEKHMPPEGKSQLTTDEINLLAWWINEGASFTKKIAELKQSEVIKKILAKYQSSGNDLSTLSLATPDVALIKDLKNDGYAIQQLSEGNAFVQIDLSHKTDLTKSSLKKLRKLGDHVSHLNLSFSNLDDKLISIVKNFPHLKVLQLQKTKITSDGINALSELQYLENLNLYGTDADDKIIKTLKDLPSLKTAYLWQTKITKEAIAQLQEDRPLLQVNYQIDEDIFGTAALKPPLIKADTDLFKDSLAISLDLNFKNVELYYTTDGSDPDSNALLYEGPFVIDKTTMVKAISMKEGWVSSELTSRQFLQSKYDVAEVKLSNTPNDRYKGSGAKTLIDFVKGSEAFTDGNWLGYEKNHVTVTLDLGKTETISQVSVSALEAAGSWIFFPKGIKISTSEDGKYFTFKKEEKYAIANSIKPAAVKNFTQAIEATDTRYVRVELESHLVNPPWHPNPGGGCWLFIDEVVVN